MDCGVEMQSLSVKCLFIQLTKLLRGALAEGSASGRLLGRSGRGPSQMPAPPPGPQARESCRQSQRSNTPAPFPAWREHVRLAFCKGVSVDFLFLLLLFVFN